MRAPLWSCTTVILSENLVTYHGRDCKQLARYVLTRVNLLLLLTFHGYLASAVSKMCKLPSAPHLHTLTAVICVHWVKLWSRSLLFFPTSHLLEGHTITSFTFFAPVLISSRDFCFYLLSLTALLPSWSGPWRKWHPC